MTEIPSPAGFGVVPPEIAKRYTGVEFLRAIIRGELPSPPITQTLDFRLAEADEGRVVFEGNPDGRTINPMGTVHGGYYATLLDSAMTCSVVSVLPAGPSCTTLEFKVTMLRAMTEKTGPVRATGTVLAPGRRVVMAEGRIVDREGRLIAHGTTTCLVLGD